ncbi:putative bifunctional diguanylate cyclase/phosphodiesterase [Algicola sagamiensis]|uniref:putative bifunctional diguanylate cyclase/phosphodiesterase n=1 Tax=Algicola sagamiensis TaxID=163869 RepID=UPI00035C100A|nr:EAL domain-containing protein [Algicola sagamiensis]
MRLNLAGSPNDWFQFLPIFLTAFLMLSCLGLVIAHASASSLEMKQQLNHDDSTIYAVNGIKIQSQYIDSTDDGAGVAQHRFGFYLSNDTDKTNRIVLTPNTINFRLESIQETPEIRESFHKHELYLVEVNRTNNYVIVTLPPYESLFFVLSSRVSKNNPCCRFIITDSENFETNRKLSTFFWGGCFGVAFLTCAYFLLLFFRLRDLSLLFLTCWLCWFLFDSSLATPVYLWPFPPIHLSTFGNNLLSIRLTTVIGLYLICHGLVDARRPIWLHFITFLSLVALSITSSFWWPVYTNDAQGVPLFLISLIAFIHLSHYVRSIHYSWTRPMLLAWFSFLFSLGLTVSSDGWSSSTNFFHDNAIFLSNFITATLLVLSMISRLREGEAAKIYYVTHDITTGLPNHLGIEHSLQYRHEQQKPYTLVLIRIDMLQQLKPSIGERNVNRYLSGISHKVRDALLALTDLLDIDTHASSHCKLAKIDEDHFAIAIDGTVARDELSYYFLALKDAFCSPVQISGFRISIPCYIGAAYFPQHGDSVKTIIKRAIQSIELARSSLDNCAIFSPKQGDDLQEHLSLAADLQHALETKSLQLFFQPQINLRTGMIVGCEALLRWNHPEKGEIHPKVSIQLAEDTRQINQLTEWIITEAFQCQAKFAQLSSKHRIALNISPRNLRDRGFMAHLLTQLHEYNLSPSQIILELTESTTVEDPAKTIEVVEQLNALGFRVAIDDYGSGYSSLHFLNDLSFHELKIDRTFIQNMALKKRHANIVKATIEMANSLGVLVIAEGIDPEAGEATANLLKQYGCDLAQGYYFSEALPMDAYLKWLNVKNETRQTKVSEL